MMKSKVLILVLAFFILVTPVHGALSDGVAAYWKSNTATSNSTHTFDSLSIFNLTFNGNAQIVTLGKISETGSYDGTQDWMESTAVTTGTGNWSVFAWINTTGGRQHIIDWGNFGAAKTGVMLYIYTDNKLHMDASSTGGCGSTTSVNNGVWHHVGVVYNNTHVLCYVDGTMENAVAMTALNLGTTHGTHLGIYGNAESDYDFTGKIDETGVWNRALSALEVTQLYNSGTGLSYPFMGVIAPVIINSTYNLTTAAAGENGTAWRNAHESTPIKTLDTTPTVTFNTSLDAYCRVHTQDWNWTGMGGDRNCTTTGSTSHVCTLPAADQYALGSGYNSLFIGCIESTLTNETTLSTSGALNLSLGFSPAINNLTLLPSPSFTDSLMNCSFRVVDNDSSVLNVTVNWTGGAYVQYFNNTANNTFLNSTWLHGTAKGTNLTCNVTVSDGETISIAGNKSTVSNSVPYGFSVSSPLNESQVFGTAVNFSWNCSDADAGDTLTSSWVLNGTPNGTDVFPNVHQLLNLSYDICYEMFGFCYDDDTAASNDITLYFCTNSTSVCNVAVSGLVDGSRYRSESVNIGLSCLTGLPASACTVSINSYAPESINCSLANLTLELGRNDVRFNVSGEEKRMIVYAKRLNESGFGAYFVIIILIAVLGFLMMAYNRWLRLGAVAVLIGLGGCVLGASIIAWSFWAGGFVIMCSIFFALYEVMKN